MSKYNEIMENLVVTKDMRERILSNVEKEMDADATLGKPTESSAMTSEKEGTETKEDIETKPGTEIKADNETSTESGKNSEKNSGNNSEKRKILEFRRYMGIAAAFAVLVVGAYAVSRVVPFGGKSNMSATSSYEAAQTTMAPEAAYETESAAPEETYATEAAVEEAIEEAHETDGIMTGSALQAEGEADANADAYAMEDAEALSPQVAKETETAGKTGSASLANSKFSIFEIFGKNGGEKSYDFKEYPSLAKLSEAAETDFVEIEYFDSFSTAKEYHLYDGKVALIYYDVAGNDVVVKEMSTNKGSAIPANISGITSDMASTSTIEIGKTTVTLVGSDDSYNIATWATNGLIFELESSEILTYDDMKTLMEQIIE